MSKHKLTQVMESLLKNKERADELMSEIKLHAKPKWANPPSNVKWYNQKFK